MHKRSRELNEPLVKRTVWPFAIRKPQIFENFVRFEKKSLVEAVKISQVSGIKFLAPKRLNELQDLILFLAQATIFEKELGNNPPV
jgi:hypothetical protein